MLENLTAYSFKTASMTSSEVSSHTFIHRLLTLMTSESVSHAVFKLQIANFLVSLVLTWSSEGHFCGWGETGSCMNLRVVVCVFPYTREDVPHQNNHKTIDFLC